jgi:hypothetical protein
MDMSSDYEYLREVSDDEIISILDMEMKKQGVTPDEMLMFLDTIIENIGKKEAYRFYRLGDRFFLQIERGFVELIQSR